MNKKCCGIKSGQIYYYLFEYFVRVVCGRELDSVSYGILWPVIEASKVARVFCSDITPLFGFGPYATRKCRKNGTWAKVDTSQCSVRPTQRYVILLYSIYTMFSNKISVASLPEIEQVCLIKPVFLLY